MTDEDAEGELETSYIVVGHISDEFDNPAPVLQWPGSENELEIGDELVRREDAVNHGAEKWEKAREYERRRVCMAFKDWMEEENPSQEEILETLEEWGELDCPPKEAGDGEQIDRPDHCPNCESETGFEHLDVSTWYCQGCGVYVEWLGSEWELVDLDNDEADWETVKEQVEKELDELNSKEKTGTEGGS